MQRTRSDVKLQGEMAQRFIDRDVSHALVMGNLIEVFKIPAEVVLHWAAISEVVATEGAEHQATRAGFSYAAWERVRKELKNWGLMTYSHKRRRYQILSPKTMGRAIESCIRSEMIAHVMEQAGSSSKRAKKMTQEIMNQKEFAFA